MFLTVLCVKLGILFLLLSTCKFNSVCVKLLGLFERDFSTIGKKEKKKVFFRCLLSFCKLFGVSSYLISEHLLWFRICFSLAYFTLCYANKKASKHFHQLFNSWFHMFAFYCIGKALFALFYCQSLEGIDIVAFIIIAGINAFHIHFTVVDFCRKRRF